MINYYLRFINFVFSIFGIAKPFMSSSGTHFKTSLLHTFWSVIVIACMIASNVMIMKSKLNFDLNIFYNMNNTIVNIIVIVNNVADRNKVCSQLYENVNKIIDDFKINAGNLNMLALKFYFGFVVTTSTLIIFVVLEFLKSDPFVLLITIPTYLSVFHLVFHLSLLLAILKYLKRKMLCLLNLDDKTKNNCLIAMSPSTSDKLKYLLSVDIKFMENDRQNIFDIKFLCRIYDDLSTCINLLEQHHGFQMLLTFWLMFTNSVFGVTMIACHNVDRPVLVMARSIVPFLWCFIGCYVNDQMSKEVEHIDTLIVKYLIDFRCEQSRKYILQTFRQLVSANRLQFTAASLFRLNYSMILGTVVNIITYSIIMVQLFLSVK